MRRHVDVVLLRPRLHAGGGVNIGIGKAFFPCGKRHIMQRVWSDQAPHGAESFRFDLQFGVNRDGGMHPQAHTPRAFADADHGHAGWKPHAVKLHRRAVCDPDFGTDLFERAERFVKRMHLATMLGGCGAEIFVALPKGFIGAPIRLTQLLGFVGVFEKLGCFALVRIFQRQISSLLNASTQRPIGRFAIRGIACPLNRACGSRQWDHRGACKRDGDRQN